MPNLNRYKVNEYPPRFPAIGARSVEILDNFRLDEGYCSRCCLGHHPGVNLGWYTKGNRLRPLSTSDFDFHVSIVEGWKGEGIDHRRGDVVAAGGE